MTTAGRALGRRPPKNAPAVRLALTEAGRGAVPEHPVSVNHLNRPGLTFGLYRNDTFSVCGPTYVANLVRLLTAHLTSSMIVPTQEDVFDLYRRSGNPDFDPATGADDNGVDMQTMLEALLAGGIGGLKPIMFAKLDHTNLDEIRAAIAIFGGIGFGVDLQEAQQAQTDSGRWEYQKSGEWGGHAILAGEYDDPTGTVQDELGVITWKELVECTDAFLNHQLEEAWVVVWPWHFGSQRFLASVDLAAMASSFKALTGRDLPIPSVPSPAPGAASFPVSAAVADRVAAVARRAHVAPTVWLERHLRVYFGLPR